MERETNREAEVRALPLEQVRHFFPKTSESRNEESWTCTARKRGARTPRDTSSLDFTIAKKMATCRFYLNALRVSSKNTWEKMTRSKANGLKF